MQDWWLPCRLAAALAVLVVLLQPVAAISRRTCFCDLRLGRLMFSPLLLDVTNPVLKDYLVSCRRAEAWCPDACRRAARARLTQGDSGDVSPLKGAAGETACAAVRRAISASTAPLHVYATYRVSNCRRSGSHYFGRLCCREGVDALGKTVYEFSESCPCEEQLEAAALYFPASVATATATAEVFTTESGYTLSPATSNATDDTAATKLQQPPSITTTTTPFDATMP